MKQSRKEEQKKDINRKMLEKSLKIFMLETKNETRIMCVCGFIQSYKNVRCWYEEKRKTLCVLSEKR